MRKHQALPKNGWAFFLWCLRLSVLIDGEDDGWIKRAVYFSGGTRNLGVSACAVAGNGHSFCYTARPDRLMARTVGFRIACGNGKGLGYAHFLALRLLVANG